MFAGGCKHAIAFLYWLLRRSEEPSPTSVECYWKKAVLSKVGSSVPALKAADLRLGEGSIEPEEEHSDFLMKVKEECKKRNIQGNLIKYLSNKKTAATLSIHDLGLAFFKNESVEQNSDQFIDFCKSAMTESLCKTLEIQTRDQYKQPFWYELRYGRITASKVYDASVCKTYDGALFEQIMGASSVPNTVHMERGRNLEEKVLKAVSIDKNIKICKTGLFLDKEYPIFGASPDGISDEYVLEVKCPSSSKTYNNYVNNGIVNVKYLSQIYLQMVLCKKQKGLFCVADPNFEENNKVNIFEVYLDRICIDFVIKNALLFWKKAIFPKLVK